GGLGNILRHDADLDRPAPYVAVGIDGRAAIRSADAANVALEAFVGEQGAEAACIPCRPEQGTAQPEEPAHARIGLRELRLVLLVYQPRVVHPGHAGLR